VEHAEQVTARRRAEDALRVAAPSSAIPAEVTIGTLHHPSLELRRPVRLAVALDGEFVTATFDQLDEFGYGADLAAAVEDWEQTIAELYFTLRAEQQRLGPSLLPLWEQLQTVVEERPCP
jgi:hypothetical protein